MQGIYEKMMRQSTKPGTLHNKCNKTKTSHRIHGMILNWYLDISTFDNEKEYIVCSNLLDMLKVYMSSNSIGGITLSQVEDDNL